MSIMALMAGGLSPPRRGRLAAAAAATAAGCHWRAHPPRTTRSHETTAHVRRRARPPRQPPPRAVPASTVPASLPPTSAFPVARPAVTPFPRCGRPAGPPIPLGVGEAGPCLIRAQPPGIIHDDRHDRWMRRAVAKGGGRGRGVVCPCRARSTSLLVSQQPTRSRLITRAAHACCPVKNVAAFLDMARIGTWTLIHFQSVCHVFCHFASCTSRGPLSRSLVWCHSMRPRATQGPSTVAGTPCRSPRAADGPRAGRAARWSGAPQPPTGQKSHGWRGARRGSGLARRGGAAPRLLPPPPAVRQCPWAPLHHANVGGRPLYLPAVPPPPRYTRGRRLAGNWTCASNGWLVAARRRDGKRPLHAPTPSLHRRARRDSGGRGGPARPLIHLACRWRERPPWPPRGGVVVVARRGGRHGV